MAWMEAFDRGLDFAEGVVDTLSGRPVRPFRPTHANAERPRPTVSTPPSTKSSPAASAAPTIAIDDIIDAVTGRAVFIVRMGGETAECSSRAFAERMRKALLLEWGTR